MSAVLITGASGFIGRALAASMARDPEVVCKEGRDRGRTVLGEV